MADQEAWTAVDRYITEHLVPSDPMLEAALEANAAAGLPSHDVAPNQGKLLYLLAGLGGVRRILEIGTLGAYSTIWLARSLPQDGRVVTLEADPKHAAVAQANLDRTGLSGVVELRLGPALDSLAALEREGGEPFDMIFIDADKPNNPEYLAYALTLSRKGTLIVADNVVRDGAIIHPEDPDPRVQGVCRFFEALAAEPRLSATAVQTVGSLRSCRSDDGRFKAQLEVAFGVRPDFERLAVVDRMVLAVTREQAHDRGVAQATMPDQQVDSLHELPVAEQKDQLLFGHGDQPQQCSLGALDEHAEALGFVAVAEVWVRLLPVPVEVRFALGAEGTVPSRRVHVGELVDGPHLDGHLGKALPGRLRRLLCSNVG